MSCGRARNPAWIETECLRNWEQALEQLAHLSLLSAREC